LIVSDFERDYYSAQEGFFTKHITNEEIDLHCDEIAKAISKIVDKGSELFIELGDAIITGDTGSNVSDLYLMLRN
jgi:glycerate-2-kinase